MGACKYSRVTSFIMAATVVVAIFVSGCYARQGYYYSSGTYYGGHDYYRHSMLSG